MDDGVGFAIGSLIGGQMYKRLGGKLSFRIFAIAALITCFAHIILRPARHCKHHLKHTQKPIENPDAAIELKLSDDELCELEPLKRKNEIMNKTYTQA